MIKNINYTKVNKLESKSPLQLEWGFRIEQEAVRAVFIIYPVTQNNNETVIFCNETGRVKILAPSRQARTYTLYFVDLVPGHMTL